MRLPPASRAVLRPSRIAVTAIVVAATATCVVIAVLPFHAALLAIGMVSVLLWGADRAYVIGLRRGPRATRELTLTADRLIVVRTGDDGLVAGHVRDASYVGPVVTTIVWRPDRSRRSRTIWLLPDMLSAEDYRRLRVMLRYSRSGVTQDASASHA